MDRNYETIRLDHRGAAAWITFNRPDAVNSISPQMVDELGAALDELKAEGRARCVVLTGGGRALCGGADLKAVRSLGDAGAQEGVIQAPLAAAGGLMRRIDDRSPRGLVQQKGLAALAAKRTAHFQRNLCRTITSEALAMPQSALGGLRVIDFTCRAAATCRTTSPRSTTASWSRDGGNRRIHSQPNLRS